MINDKIAAAKQAKRRHLFKTLLFVLLISLLGLALIIWASLPKSADDASQDIVVESESTSHLTSEVDGPLLREAYIEAFAEFENALRPQLNKIDLPQWDKPLADRLKSLESRALKQFSSGDYHEAYASIKTLSTQAESTISESKKQFEQAFQNAEDAFDDNDYARAKPAIDKAQLLDNTSEKAQKFGERVEKLPEIAELVSQIKTANAENNPQRERDLIKQLLKLTPEQESLKQRAQQLTNQLNTSQFQRHIAQGYQGLENAQPSSARTALNKAKQIYPGRAEVQKLGNAIQQAQETQRIRELQADATQAESAGNWTKVEASLRQIQSLRPNDKAVNEKLAVASDIVDLQSELDKTLASPYRLTDSAAADDAQALVAAARDYQAKSAILTNKSRELKALLEAVNQPVDVKIRSDNQTYITVRGVGIVGETEVKTIQLKPGNYTFEGKRPGYQSKLAEVQVPLDLKPVTLTLICDEPI